MTIRIPDTPTELARQLLELPPGLFAVWTAADLADKSDHPDQWGELDRAVHAECANVVPDICRTLVLIAHVTEDLLWWFRLARTPDDLWEAVRELAEGRAELGPGWRPAYSETDGGRRPA